MNEIGLFLFDIGRVGLRIGEVVVGAVFYGTPVVANTTSKMLKVSTALWKGVQVPEQENPNKYSYRTILAAEFLFFIRIVELAKFIPPGVSMIGTIIGGPAIGVALTAIDLVASVLMVAGTLAESKTPGESRLFWLERSLRLIGYSASALAAFTTLTIPFLPPPASGIVGAAAGSLWIFSLGVLAVNFGVYLICHRKAIYGALKKAYLLVFSVAQTIFHGIATTFSSNKIEPLHSTHLT